MFYAWLWCVMPEAAAMHAGLPRQEAANGIAANIVRGRGMGRDPFLRHRNSHGTRVALIHVRSDLLLDGMSKVMWVHLAYLLH
jgi:hypothetical protein